MNQKTAAKFFLPFAAAAVIVGIWQIVCDAGAVPRFMLPSPAAVCSAFISEFPLLMRHLRVTLFEAACGLALSVAFALILALVMDMNRYIKAALEPVLLFTQTLPSIVIAPLLVLWFGYETMPKIVLIFITCFFPLAVSLVNAFAQTDKDAVNLLKSMGAKKVHIYCCLKLPQSMPAFFAGLRISASYAMIGAVIAEWLGGSAGLGVYMIRVRKSYSFDKMFACLVLTMLLSMALLYAAIFLEWYAMPWKRHANR